MFTADRAEQREAYYRDDSLTEVMIPDGIASIGMFSFSDCSFLSRIIIPDSVIAIEYGAFQNCANLNEVKL